MHVGSKKSGVITVPVGGPLDAVLDVVYAAGQTPLLAGGTGVGKSTRLEDYAGGNEWGCVALDLSLMEPPDLVGLPPLDGEVTRYLPPETLPTEADGDI